MIVYSSIRIYKYKVIKEIFKEMRILIFADIHIGSIYDSEYVYSVITNIIDKEVTFKHTDIVVISGDYFHKLFKCNDDLVICGINVMSYLVRACMRENTKIRIVYGTEFHEMNQYRLFNYHLTSSDIDMKVFTTVTEEEIDGYKILYIPEEYMMDKHEHYKKYLYSGKHYDYIFLHGVIEEGMTMLRPSNDNNKEKKVPRFNRDELAAVSDICVAGHYHVHSDIGDGVYYLGSLLRDSFGEEEPKGYGIIEDKVFTFVENNRAYIYKTYEYNEDNPIYQSADNFMSEINKIKKENVEIFNGERGGKIRIKMNCPSNMDQNFKESAQELVSKCKQIVLVMKYNMEEVDTVEAEVTESYKYLLDRSLPVLDKIHRFINETHDPMPLETLKRYIGNIVK